jgi:hypothetical protein
MTVPPPVTNLDQWHTQVRRRFPGPLTGQAARLLARLATPGTAHVDLDPPTVHHLLHTLHLLRPPGLRRLIGKLTTAGLLTLVHPGTGRHWGTYHLTLPTAGTPR